LRALGSALLCSFASTVTSSMQPEPPVLTISSALEIGGQPKGSNFDSPNFLPPIL
jgi:hypothetical protein